MVALPQMKSDYLCAVCSRSQTRSGQARPRIPLLVVLCNHIAQVSMDAPVITWWLMPRTTVFYTCISSGCHTRLNTSCFRSPPPGRALQPHRSSVYGRPCHLLVVLCNHIAQVSMDAPVISWWLMRRTTVFYICLSSGIPLLVVLCNHIAQVSMDAPVISWWLMRRTTVFYTCLSSGCLLIILFVFLHFHVSKRLRSLVTSKNVDTKKAITRRLGLLNRAGVVFGATTIMAGSSVLYINYPTVRCQYLFSLSSALLGFLLLVCYILHCESPLHLHVLRTFKLQHADNPAFSSESDSSPLSIFTKQEAEVECEGAPPHTHDKPPPHNGRPEPHKESPPTACHRTRDTEATKENLSLSSICLNMSKGVNFKSELSTVSEKVSKDEQQYHHQPLVDMEVYPGSPRKLSKEPGDLQLSLPPDPGTTRVCVITSVVVDTPSVVVCSVDVEPCTVLNKSIVSSEVASNPLPIKAEEECPAERQEEDKSDVEETETETDADVMDRICHDLDYLLGGVKNSRDDAAIPNILIQHTSL
ncbi:hypothetical protein J6590_086981 [Homalodisca vitripennis]|nr:hypothetical protein J6590_086981 [Homalodisca vitripennis]